MAKKTFYEILGVPPHASADDIRQAHQRKIEGLRAEEASMRHEDYEFELKILNMAFGTLSDAQMRSTYDLRLAAAPPPSMDVQAPSGNAMQPLPAEALSRRADVLSLRADAMALRADAIATKLDLGEEVPQVAPANYRSPVLQLAKLVVAAVVGYFVIRMASNFFLVQQIAQSKQESSLAEEKVIIQEHYQTYGVRPASAAEARLLQAEYEREERAQREAEREEQRKEEEQRRFAEDSRRLAERVSSDLRSAEEAERARAEWEAREEQERLERERQQKEYEEQERIRRQQEKWDRVLRR
ncbi:MAG: DnaJ domain-containing protein [Pseudomonadota bacterium]